jgi:ribonuclease HII
LNLRSNVGIKNLEGKAIDRLIGGVDEAGRGALVGPLIVAGISIKSSRLHELVKIGIKDSKMLSPKQRRSLVPKLVDQVEFICICKLTPTDVDRGVINSSLNLLEAQAMAVVIENIFPDTVFIDSCDVNPIRYRKSVSEFVCVNRPRRIISLHHAEDASIAVAGASIVAKVTRDYEMLRIRQEYGEMGSGYPSDKKTKKFVREWIEKNNTSRQFIRESWKPMKTLLNRDYQV